MRLLILCRRPLIYQVRFILGLITEFSLQDQTIIKLKQMIDGQQLDFRCDFEKQIISWEENTDDFTER